MFGDVCELWIVDDNALRRAAFHAVLAPIAQSEGITLNSVRLQDADLWTDVHAARGLALVVLGGEPLNSDRGRSIVERMVQQAGCMRMAVILDEVTGTDIELALDFRLRGIISTKDEPGVALAAIKFLIAGGRYVPHDRAHGSTLQKAPLSGIASLADALPKDQTGAPDDGLASLTRRQEEVFAALSRGASNKSIARALQLSEATVKIHVRHILQKLAVKSRVEAALYARNGSVRAQPAEAIRTVS